MAKAGEHKTVKCLICKAEYRQSRSDQIYCSGRCSSVAWRARRQKKTIICCNCGVSFDQSHSNDKYCSKSCASCADRKRRQAKNTGDGKGWSKGSVFVTNNAVCQICGTYFHVPDCYKRRGGLSGNYCSVRCRAKHLSENPSMWPHKNWRRGKGGKREDLNVYFRSTWEANYARYLNFLKEKKQIEGWKFEPDVFEFPVKKGSRFYTPDFKITNNNGTIEYHEVKGYMDQRSSTKLKRMAKYYPGVKLILIDKEAYKSIARSIHMMIPNWEGGNECRKKSYS